MLITLILYSFAHYCEQPSLSKDFINTELVQFRKQSLIFRKIRRVQESNNISIAVQKTSLKRWNLSISRECYLHKLSDFCFCFEVSPEYSQTPLHSAWISFKVVIVFFSVWGVWEDNYCFNHLYCCINMYTM